MPKALVLGVNGQDGGYLAESLLRRRYDVVGAGRQAASRFIGETEPFRYRQLDLEDRTALTNLLVAEEPDIVFYVAAIHGSAGFCYEPVFASMMAVNVVSLQAVLEYARTHRPLMRVIYANSAKIFAGPLAGVVNEGTVIRPTCLYGVGKVAALELVRYYRARYSIAAANLILFNHESPRRPPEYFLSTMAAGLARALLDRTHQFPVRTLDFWMDWSSAEELMDIAVDIGEQAPSDDYVLASGTTWHARQVVQEWFARHGLEYSQHVVESLPAQQLGPRFTVELDHVSVRIGRKPERTVKSITDELLTALRPS